MNEVNIKELCEKINNLTREENKTDFLKNYSKYKDIIDDIDAIFDKKIDETNIIDDDDTSIDNLFKIIEKYDNIINSNSDINLESFKNLKDVIELLQNKLNMNNEIKIKEIK